LKGRGIAGGWAGMLGPEDEIDAFRLDECLIERCRVHRKEPDFIGLVDVVVKDRVPALHPHSARALLADIRRPERTGDDQENLVVLPARCGAACGRRERDGAGVQAVQRTLRLERRPCAGGGDHCRAQRFRRERARHRVAGRRGRPHLGRGLPSGRCEAHAGARQLLRLRPEHPGASWTVRGVFVLRDDDVLRRLAGRQGHVHRMHGSRSQ
jgi:hypothetical protein